MADPLRNAVLDFYTIAACNRTFLRTMWLLTFRDHPSALNGDLQHVVLGFLYNYNLKWSVRISSLFPTRVDLPHRWKLRTLRVPDYPFHLIRSGHHPPFDAIILSRKITPVRKWAKQHGKVVVESEEHLTDRHFQTIVEPQKARGRYWYTVGCSSLAFPQLYQNVEAAVQQVTQGEYLQLVVGQCRITFDLRTMQFRNDADWIKLAIDQDDGESLRRYFQSMPSLRVQRTYGSKLVVENCVYKKKFSALRVALEVATLHKVLVDTHDLLCHAVKEENQLLTELLCGYVGCVVSSDHLCATTNPLILKPLLSHWLGIAGDPSTFPASTAHYISSLGLQMTSSAAGFLDRAARVRFDYGDCYSECYSEESEPPSDNEPSVFVRHHEMGPAFQRCNLLRVKEVRRSTQRKMRKNPLSRRTFPQANGVVATEWHPGSADPAVQSYAAVARRTN